MKKTKWYQRQLIVNPKVQYVYAVYTVALAVLFFAAGGVAALVAQRIAVYNANGWELSGNYDFVLVGLLTGILLCATYVGFVLSNRIVGPIFRLITHMENLSAGSEIKTLRFRKEDYYQDLAESYNRVLDRLEDSENRPSSLQ